MSLLQNVTQKALQGWMEENHPLLDMTCCLNKKQRKFTCTACKDICPHGVFDDKNPDWELCDDCNLCVVACPSQAICPSLAALRGFIQLLDLENETVSIACSRSDFPADLRVGCLATVPWEMVARIALDKSLVLDLDACATCEKAAEREQLATVLGRAETFLGSEYFADRVRTTTEGADEVGVSRREAFTSFWSRLRTTVASIVPGEALARSADGAVYRKILVSRLSARQEEGLELALTWETPIINDACTACTVCTRTCVHKAIEALPRDEAEDIRRIQHHGNRCVHCGLCETLCPAHAIEGWTTYTMTDPLGIAETHVTVKIEPEQPKTPVLAALKKREWQRAQDTRDAAEGDSQSTA